jgi:hypothetical protein
MDLMHDGRHLHALSYTFYTAHTYTCTFFRVRYLHCMHTHTWYIQTATLTYKPQLLQSMERPFEDIGPRALATRVVEAVLSQWLLETFLISHIYLWAKITHACSASSEWGRFGSRKCFLWRTYLSKLERGDSDWGQSGQKIFLFQFHGNFHLIFASTPSYSIVFFLWYCSRKHNKLCIFAIPSISPFLH